jgi:hypothetical protein
MHVASYASSLPIILSRDSLARQITEAWQRQVPAIFEVGDLLVSAQAALRHGEWIAMIRDNLPFNRKTAHKLQKIATDPKLRNVSPGRLPAHWTLLYDLTTLDDEQFARGIATDIINERMQRKDIKTLRGDQPRETSGRPSLREQLADARQEIERLRRMGGNLFDASTPAFEVAAVLADTNFSPSKVDRIIAEWRRRLRERERQG